MKVVRLSSSRRSRVFGLDTTLMMMMTMMVTMTMKTTTATATATWFTLLSLKNLLPVTGTLLIGETIK